MLHIHAHKNTAVTAAFLLGRVAQMQESNGQIQKGPKFAGDRIRFPNIPLVQRVVVECNSVDDGDQE